MINNKLLDAYISENKFDNKYIADSLSITEDEFLYKKDVVKDFSIMEIFKLCDILHNISDPVKLFFAED